MHWFSIALDLRCIWWCIDRNRRILWTYDDELMETWAWVTATKLACRVRKLGWKLAKISSSADVFTRQVESRCVVAVDVSGSERHLWSLNDECHHWDLLRCDLCKLYASDKKYALWCGQYSSQSFRNPWNANDQGLSSQSWVIVPMTVITIIYCRMSPSMTT